MVQSWFVINELDHSILHQKLNGVITQASARTKYLPSWFGIPYLESTYFGGHLPTMMAIYTYPYHWWWYNCDRMRTECEHTRRLNRLVSKIIERTFQKTWLWPPNIRLRFQSFFKHFLESWSLVLILGWIWLTSFFSSTRSQAATCGLNRSWTLIRLDTSLGVSRKPGAQHVVSQHILCMVCIYIYI